MVSSMKDTNKVEFNNSQSLSVSCIFNNLCLDNHFWVLDNQIPSDGCPKDKWIFKFLAHPGFVQLVQARNLSNGQSIHF